MTVSRSPFACVLVGALCLWLPAGCRHGGSSEPKRQQGQPVASADNVGTVEQRWDDGRLRLRKQITHNRDGVAINHGTYERWHKNGQKEYQAVFVHGKKEGTTTLWHRNGGKWREEQYVDGLRHGVGYTWDENGAKRKEEHHVRGRPHGTWTVWDGKGQVKWQGRFDVEAERPQEPD